MKRSIGKGKHTPSDCKARVAFIASGLEHDSDEVGGSGCSLISRHTDLVVADAVSAGEVGHGIWEEGHSILAVIQCNIVIIIHGEEIKVHGHGLEREKRRN